jgi:hypothetical protein
MAADKGLTTPALMVSRFGQRSTHRSGYRRNLLCH